MKMRLGKALTFKKFFTEFSVMFVSALNLLVWSFLTTQTRRTFAMMLQALENSTQSHRYASSTQYISQSYLEERPSQLTTHTDLNRLWTLHMIKKSYYSVSFSTKIISKFLNGANMKQANPLLLWFREWCGGSSWLRVCSSGGLRALSPVETTTMLLWTGETTLGLLLTL